ncbi:MAG: glycosyltransferase family 39 protein [Nanoarchaeota archaeon]
MKSKKIFWIFALALVIRILMIGLHETIEIDGVYYSRLGYNLINGGGYIDVEGNVNTVFTPLYPILIGIFDLVFGNLEFTARIISVIFGALLIFPVYMLARRLYNEKVALVSALITAVYPALAYISTITYSDSLYLFLLYNLFYFGYRALEEKKRSLYAISGLLGGLLYLARPEGAFYTFLIALLAVFWSRKDIRSAARNIILLLVVFAMVVSPFVLFAYNQTGDLSLSSKGYVVYKFREFKPFTIEYERNIFGLNEEKTDIKLNPYTVKGSLANEIMNNLPNFFSRYFYGLFKEIYFVIPMLFPLVIFSIISFFRKFDKKDLKKEYYLLALIAYPILFFPVFWVEVRYMLPILPVLVMWASNGILNIDRLLNRKWISTFLLIVIVAFSLAGNVLANQLVDKRFEKQDPPLEHREAGKWLKENFDSPVIMERKPWASFYSGGTFVNLPYGNFSDVKEYGCYKKAEFMIADERYVGKLRPGLSYLLEKEKSEPDIVYENERNKNRLIVYKLDC